MTLPPDSEVLDQFLVRRNGRPVGILIIYKHCDKIRVAGYPQPATPFNLERIQQTIRKVQQQYGSYT